MQELVEDINKLITLLKVKNSFFEIEYINSNTWNNNYELQYLRYHNLVLSQFNQYEKYKFHYRNIKIEFSDEIINLIKKISGSKYIKKFDEMLSIHINSGSFNNKEKYVEDLNKIFNINCFIKPTFETNIKRYYDNYDKNYWAHVVYFNNLNSIYHYISCFTSLYNIYSYENIMHHIRNLQYIERFQYKYYIDVLCKKDKYQCYTYVKICNVLLQKYALY